MIGFGTAFKRQMNNGALKARNMVKKGGKAAGRGVKKMSGMVKDKRRRTSGQNLQQTSTLGREIEM